MPLWWTRFLEPDPPAGGGGDGGKPGDDDKEPKTRDELRTQIKRMADRRGGLEEVCIDLMEEQLDARGKQREIRKQLDAVKAPGALVLTAEQAKTWAAYQAINPDPVKLKESLDTAAAGASELAGLKHEKVARTVAGLDPYKYNADALVEVVRDKGLLLIPGEVEIDDGKGKKTKVQGATVRPAHDEKATPVELSAYVAQHLKLYEPILTAQRDAPPTGSRPGARPGVTFPAQRGTEQPSRPAEPTAEELEAEARATGGVFSL